MNKEIEEFLKIIIDIYVRIYRTIYLIDTFFFNL